MLVATPGQSTAYVLHNNSGITTTTANISTPTVTSVTTSVSASSSVVATKKHQAVLNKLCSSKETPKCVNNYNNNTSSQATKSANTITNFHNNHSHNFHAPSNKRDSSNTNSIIRNSLTSTSSSFKHHNNQINQHSSLKNSSGTSTSRPQSFLSTLKDTVQKALVSTATSLTKNGGSRASAATGLHSSNTTSNSNNTSSASLHVTSSALSRATTKNSSTTVNTISTSESSATSASATLPLTIARKNIFQTITGQPKLHTIPPTILHRIPEERQKASSTDSLQKEMCHFKPIRTVPTTPWKSGSKSRGTYLRFPKANLATTKTEFILKSNCDVNNRKRRQQTKLKHTHHQIGLNIAEETGDNNEEQENKAHFEIYKPQPSSLHLPASFRTQNHQSAFVCLVANFIEMQSSSPKAIDDSVVSPKSKVSRVVARSKGNDTAKAKAASPAVFVRHKKFKSPLPPTLSAKRAKIVTPLTRSRQRGSGKATELSNMAIKSAELLGNVTPSTRRAKDAKSLITYTQQTPLTDAAKVAPLRRSKKRKGAEYETDSTIVPLTSSGISVSPAPSSRSSVVGARRSARLTAESVNSNLYIKYPELRFTNAKFQILSQRNQDCFSPPLTRSRLKQFLNQQQTETELRASLIPRKSSDMSASPTPSSASSVAGPRRSVRLTADHYKINSNFKLPASEIKFASRLH